MPEPKDMFKDADWDSIETQEDFENEISELKGDYRGEIKDFKFIEMEESGFYSLNVQITETVKGIEGNNRYISRTFNIGETQYSTAQESKDKLLKALKTIGVKSPEEAIGKPICVKLRPNMDKETKKVKRDSGGWPKHIVTIVKEFKGVEPTGDSPSPF